MKTKHYLISLVVLTMTALSISLAGCGSDSDEPNETSIVGVWKWVDDEQDNYFTGILLQLGTNNKATELFYDYYYNNNKRKGYLEKYTGTFSSTNKRLILKMSGYSYSSYSSNDKEQYDISDEIAFEIISISKNKMVLKCINDDNRYCEWDGGETYHLIKSSETEINSYLQHFQ